MSCRACIRAAVVSGRVVVLALSRQVYTASPARSSFLGNRSSVVSAAPNLLRRASLSDHHLMNVSSSAVAVMGAGGSKEGEEGQRERKSTKKAKEGRRKETATVATAAQSEGAAPAAGKEERALAGDDEYVECKVAKVSEFGENE